MCKVYRLYLAMIFIFSTMRQICLLVAGFLLSSVVGRDIVNLEDEAEIQLSMNDKPETQRRLDAAAATCGRTKVGASKRDDETAQSNLDKILGGTYVTRGEIPWQVNIYGNKYHRCGGVIVAEFWILTSAKCVHPKDTNTSLLSLVVGDNLMDADEKEQQKFGANKVIVHQMFSSKSYANDIALIKVTPTNNRGIVFNDYVQPVCLPNEGESKHPAVETKLTISGWGFVSIDDNIRSNVLKKDTLIVEKCPTNIGNITNNDCGRSSNGKTNACKGDLGGPATFKSQEWIVVSGIIIAGDGCFSQKLPVILASLAYHRTWVLDTIAANSNETEKFIPGRT